jgi:hypothetical protein
MGDCLATASIGLEMTGTLRWAHSSRSSGYAFADCSVGWTWRAGTGRADKRSAAKTAEKYEASSRRSSPPECFPSGRRRSTMPIAA